MQITSKFRGMSRVGDSGVCEVQKWHQFLCRECFVNSEMGYYADYLQVLYLVHVSVVSINPHPSWPPWTFSSLRNIQTQDFPVQPHESCTSWHSMAMFSFLPREMVISSDMEKVNIISTSVPRISAGSSSVPPLYSCSLSEVISLYEFSYLCYADVTQLILSSLRHS